jgi:hypothetical protein
VLAGAHRARLLGGPLLHVPATEGQLIFALVCDLFGWGWDLFGTAGYEPNVGVVNAALVWYSQVALIVGGHVFAVYLAHAPTPRQMPNTKRTLRSQYPMVVLMILYLASGSGSPPNPSSDKPPLTS